jgi:hypothetical protein
MGYRYHWPGWVLLVSGQVEKQAQLNTNALKRDRTELLLEKGYEVHGIIRRSSSFNTSRLHHLYTVRIYSSERLSTRR